MSGADLPSSVGGSAGVARAPLDAPEGRLARVAGRFTAWAERWIPSSA